MKILQLDLMEISIPNSAVCRAQFPGCHTLEVSWYPDHEGAPFAGIAGAHHLARLLLGPDGDRVPNLQTLRLRWPTFDMPPWFAGLSCLTTASCYMPDSTWLPLLTALPHVTHLELSLKEDALPLREWCNDSMWGRLRSLALETPSSQRLTARGSIETGFHPFKMLLKGLVLPKYTTVTTLSLSVGVQRIRRTAVRTDFARLVRPLEALRGLSQLTNLTINDYALATPASVASLAQVWPHLTSVTFGPWVDWSGTPVETALALAAWPKLRALQCPPWLEEGKPCASPEDVVSKLAISLKELELLYLNDWHRWNGRQSEEEWFRVIRSGGSDGRPAGVERVRVYDTDLDRPDEVDPNN